MKKLAPILFLIFTVFISFQVSAQEICPLNGQPIKPKGLRSFESLKKLPILDGGRVKPFETYAQNILLQFSGKRTYEKKSAVEWLARLLLSPEFTRDDKIFLINNPDILSAIGVKEEKKRRYSYNQLQPGFPKLAELADSAQSIKENERDLVENEIIRVFHNLQLYSSLSLSFSFAFPHDDFLIEDQKILDALELDQGPNSYSFLDVALRAEKLNSITQTLEKLPQNLWSDEQKKLIDLVTRLFAWAQEYHDLPLTIVPSYLPKDERWYSPWDAIARGFNQQEGRNEIINLRNVLLSYWAGDQIAFDISIRKFISSTSERYEQTNIRAQHIGLELFVNKLNPFSWAMTGYLIIFFIFLSSLLVENPKLYKTAWIILWISFALHALGLTMRIIILQRPPVSTLYETFIFVGFIAALSGIIIEKVNKQWVGLITAGVAGFALLMIASKYSAEGDTMKMLVAVLNSNFWLGTHVLSITTGYGGVCVAGVVGHIYMLQRIFKSKDKKLLDSTYHILIGTLGFGLTMTFLGTNLGGIWADESWGRFWGWDPKENGALLIVIWTALLFHAKIAKLIGPLGLAVGSILGIIVVMWAWFGVNLLSIGLHSYGFTQGIALNLLIYLILQVVFLIVCYPLAKSKT